MREREKERNNWAPRKSKVQQWQGKSPHVVRNLKQIQNPKRERGRNAERVREVQKPMKEAREVGRTVFTAITFV